MTSLNKLTPGQQGTVVGFSEDSKISRRLIELGFVPGRSVKYVRNAPFADPMEVQIGSCCLSLRHSEASLVHIELENE